MLFRKKKLALGNAIQNRSAPKDFPIGRKKRRAAFRFYPGTTERGKAIRQEPKDIGQK